MAEPWWKKYADEFYSKKGIDPETGDVSDVSRETLNNDSNIAESNDNVGQALTPQLAEDGSGVRIDENGNPQLFIIVDDPAEAMKAEPPEIKPLRPVDAVDLEAKAMLLNSQGVESPKSMQKKSWWERNSDTILDFLHHFNRPGSAVLAGATDWMYQFKDAVKEAEQAYQEGRLFEGGSPIEAIKDNFERDAKLVETMKEGFQASREDAPTGRDFIKSVVGAQALKKGEKFFQDWAELTSLSPEELAKRPVDEQAMSFLGSGVLGNLQRIYGKDKKDKISPVLLNNAIQFGVYLPMEIVADPLTYVPFGLPAKLVANGTANTLKGGLKGIAKVSPRAAEKIVEYSEKAGKAVEEAYVKYWKSWVYPKGAAEKSAAKVLGEEEAANLIDDIHVLAHAAPGATEEVVKGLDDIARAPTKVGFIRKGVQKAFEKLGYTPENRLTKYLAGMEDRREWLEKTTSALRNINDESTAILAPSLSEEVQKTIQGLLNGNATDEEVDRVVKAFSNGYAPKPKSEKEIAEALQPSAVGEVGIPVSKKIDLDQAEQFQKIQNVESSFESGMKSARREAISMARARRDLRLKQLDERFSVMQKTLSEAGGDVERVEKEMRKNLNWLTAKTKQTAEVEWTKRTRMIQNELREGLGSIKQQADNAIAAVKSEKVKGLTQLDRTRMLREQDAKIAKIKLETQKQSNALKKFYEQKMRDGIDSFQKESEGFFRGEAAKISNEYNKRIESVRYGLPDKQHLSLMYDKAKKEILDQFGGEAKFLHQEMKKVKFFNAYNTMLSNKAEEFSKIFEKNIKDLPKDYQKLARAVRDVMDGLAIADVKSGKLKSFSPNYFPRFAVTGEDGLNVVSRDEFEKGLRGMMQGSGMSKFTKERVAADYGSFLNSLERRGLKPVDDLYEIVYNRVLSSKKEQAYREIIDLVPDVLKSSESGGNATKYLRSYIKNLYDGGEVFNNLAKSKFYKAYTTYNYWNKALLTAVSPIFHATNALSAPFMTAAKAGLKAFNPVTYAEAAGVKTGALLNIKNKLGEKMSAKEFMEAGKRFGGFTHTFSSADFTKTVDRVLNRYSKSDPRHWIVKSIGLGQEVEELNRTHAAYTFWKEGKPLRQAWKLSRDAQFDYADLNNFTKAVNGMLAFFTWNAKNLPAQVRAMADDPKQFSLLGRILKAANGGNFPTQEDLALLNDRDKNQLWVFGKAVEGMQEAKRVGFIPLQEAFADVKNLSEGDLNGYLESKASFLNPLAKSFLKWTYNAIRPPYDELDPKNQELPENLTYTIGQSPKAIRAINDLSKFFTGEPIKVIDKPIWRNGEQKMEKRIIAPPVMYELLSSNPLARVMSETGQAIKVAGKEKGPGEAGISDLISDGASAEDILKFMFGIKYKQFHYDAMREGLQRKKLKEVESLLMKHKMMGTIKYIRKDFKDQFKAFKSYVKQQEVENE